MEVTQRNAPSNQPLPESNASQSSQNAPPPPISEQDFLRLVRDRNYTIPDPSEGLTLPGSVTKLISPMTGAKIFIVGTAHVSRQSSIDVRNTIRALKPHQVILELCPSRRVMIDPVLSDLKTRFESAIQTGAAPMDVVQTIRQEEDAKDAKALAEAENDKKKDQTTEKKDESTKTETSAPEKKSNRFWDWVKDSYSLIRSNSPGSWFAVLLTGLYKRVEGQLKIESGVEMRAGAVEAALVNAKIMLGDRPIRITLNRTWSAMSMWQKVHFAGSLIIAAFSSISAEDVESLKQEDLLESVIKELSQTYPSLAKHIVEERDEFLAHTIRSAPGPFVVAIVGAAHVPGIKANWEKDIDVASLLVEPPPSVAVSLTKKLFKLGLVLLVPLAVAYYFWR